MLPVNKMFPFNINDAELIIIKSFVFVETMFPLISTGWGEKRLSWTEFNINVEPESICIVTTFVTAGVEEPEPKVRVALLVT